MPHLVLTSWFDFGLKGWNCAGWRQQLLANAVVRGVFLLGLARMAAPTDHRTQPVIRKILPADKSGGCWTEDQE